MSLEVSLSNSESIYLMCSVNLRFLAGASSLDTFGGLMDLKDGLETGYFFESPDKGASKGEGGRVLSFEEG